MFFNRKAERQFRLMIGAALSNIIGRLDTMNDDLQTLSEKLDAFLSRLDSFLANRDEAIKAAVADAIAADDLKEHPLIVAMEAKIDAAMASVPPVFSPSSNG